MVTWSLRIRQLLSIVSLFFQSQGATEETSHPSEWPHSSEFTSEGMIASYITIIHVCPVPCGALFKSIVWEPALLYPFYIRGNRPRVGDLSKVTQPDTEARDQDSHQAVTFHQHQEAACCGRSQDLGSNSVLPLASDVI